MKKKKTITLKKSAVKKRKKTNSKFQVMACEKTKVAEIPNLLEKLPFYIQFN